MKGLTISQPYASLIASGDKLVENRTWMTTYKGPIAIHAGKGTQYLTAEQLREYPTGSIVAIASLEACVTRRFIVDSNPGKYIGSYRAGQLASHEHTEGPWCWVLGALVPLPEPLPCRGAQGLWEVPSDVLAEISRMTLQARRM